MKRNIEIDDTLEDRIETAIEQVKEALTEYLTDNEPDDCPDMGDLDYSGTIHEIVDGSVPIYTKEIDDTWYLHKRDLISAYEDAGIGSNPQENDGMTAIYCLIQQRVYEWYHKNAEEVFEEWQEKQPTE